jgi:hypothetical protein
MVDEKAQHKAHACLSCWQLAFRRNQVLPYTQICTHTNILSCTHTYTYMHKDARAQTHIKAHTRCFSCGGYSFSRTPRCPPECARVCSSGPPAVSVHNPSCCAGEGQEWAGGCSYVPNQVGWVGWVQLCVYNWVGWVQLCVYNRVRWVQLVCT